MSRMFNNAEVFNGDIEKWDVSSVTDMSRMFQGADIFNGDISDWDVSSVNNMNDMFSNAVLFTRNLCGAAWVHSEASKIDMFEGSSGSISGTECKLTTIPSAQYASRRPIPDRELIVRTPDITP